MSEIDDKSGWTRTDSKVLQVLTSVLAQHNREHQAAAILECLLELDPTHPELRPALGVLYLEMGRFDDALEIMDTCLAGELSPTVRSTLILARGHALWGLDRSEEAEAEMKKYFEEKPYS